MGVWMENYILHGQLIVVPLCVYVCVCVCVRVCHSPNHILYLPGRLVAAVRGHVYINTDKFENSNFPLHLPLAPSTRRWNFSQSTLHR